MRIDKLISDAGIASRREASLAARRGGILVNGVAVRSASMHIDPLTDEVTYLGRQVVYRRFTYVMLNKPAGYVSATEDKSLPYVTELLSEELRRTELFPVGRLDRDTVGLMLLTNNGALAHDLLSPKRHVEKDYRFRCAVPLAKDAEERFAKGIVIDGGVVCKSAGLRADADRLGGVITLTEGKYHQIKRMLEALDNKIVFLERIRFAKLALDPSLSRGEYRLLTEEEIAQLQSHGHNNVN